MAETETKIINIKDRNFKNKLNGLMRVDQKNQSNLHILPASQSIIIRPEIY